jgi:hypothetical protein
MIIHPATVELHPNDLRMLRESGLPLESDEARDRPVPIGRADFASRLRAARALVDDPGQLAVILSFMKQLRV